MRRCIMTATSQSAWIGLEKHPSAERRSVPKLPAQTPAPGPRTPPRSRSLFNAPVTPPPPTARKVVPAVHSTADGAAWGQAGRPPDHQGGLPGPWSSSCRGFTGPHAAEAVGTGERGRTLPPDRQTGYCSCNSLSMLILATGHNILPCTLT